MIAMRNETLKSNGFGTYEQKIIVRVDTKHVEKFEHAFDTQPFRTTPKHSDFTIQLRSKKRGDDESVMYEIDNMLPDLPAFQGWEVLWDESTY